MPVVATLKTIDLHPFHFQPQYLGTTYPDSELVIFFCGGLTLRRDSLPLLCFCCCVKKFKFFLFQVGEVEYEHTFLEKTVWI